MDLAAQLQSTLAALALVVGLVLLLAWVVRRLRAVRGGPLTSLMEVRGVLSLGARERLLLVRVHDREVLLAQTASALSAVAEFAADAGADDGQRSTGAAKTMRDCAEGEGSTTPTRLPAEGLQAP